MSNKVFCSACGAALTTDQAFCYNCGAANVRYAGKSQSAELNVNKDIYTAADTAENEQTVTAELIERDVVEEEIYAPKPIVVREKTKKPNKLSIPAVIRKSVILAVSIALLIFAFLPVFSAKITVKENDMTFEPEVSVGAIDNIVFFFDAIQSLDNTDIQDSQLYEEMEDLWQDIDGDLSSESRLDRHERDEVNYKLGRLVIGSMRISMQSEDYSIVATLIAGAIISFVYILAAVAFFVVALVDLLVYVLGNQTRKIEVSSITLLALIPMLVLAVAAALSMSINFNAMTADSVGLGGCAITSLVVSLCCIVYLMIDRLVISKSSKTKASEIVRRSVIIAVAILIICAAFTPVMALEVKTTFSGKTSPYRETQLLNAAIFNSFNVGIDEIDSYDEADNTFVFNRLDNSCKSYAHYTSKEFSKGHANGITASLLKDSFMGFGGAFAAPIIAVMPVVLLVAVLAACVIVWMNLRALAIGRAPSGWVTIPMKIVGILFALMALVIVIVTMVICNYNMGYISTDIGSAILSIGAATIMATAGSIAVTCIPMGKAK